MADSFLYHQIAESIRNDILTGRYNPGDRLPSVRQMCGAWNCTPGTIQRAYRELAREGLLVSQAGRGTRVAGSVPQSSKQGRETIRRANLVNRMESVLLEALTAGYTLSAIQQAVDLAMDRWRSFQMVEAEPQPGLLRFAGSHDMIVNELAHTFFGQVVQGIDFQISYNGSLGGLISLVEGKADLAGCHLWDVESGTYNIPFIQRLLPGVDVTVVTLAHRRQGLIVAPGNPLNIQGISDLVNPKIRFVNRQPGSGTRVWLDAMLARFKIDSQSINGYSDERLTHSDVARSISEGKADVGLGLESAGSTFGLGFIFLNRERYDLVMKTNIANRPGIKELIHWLASDKGKLFIAQFAGYENQLTGCFQNKSVI